MKRFLKKCTAMALTMILAIQLIPTVVYAATYEEMATALPEVLTLDADDHIMVTASKENGGFLIDTKDGDKLSQSDDNKFLLYPDDYYNTSFTSFRITEGGVSKDYIFGREYGFLGMDSEMLSVTTTDSQIVSVWELDDLEFTQTLTVLNTDSDYHGMVNISYSVKNNGSTNYDIQARIMLDTALGYQDYGYYELTGTGGYQQVTYECLLDNTNEAAYQNLFFAYNDPYTPTVRSYTVNDSAIPTQVAIGHWSNLASTVFDFVPDTAMNFTNTYNVEHLTADSAYALYYDMGSVGASGSSSISTNYGIYSNVTADLSDSISLNITEAPKNMEIPADADLTSEDVAYVDDGAFEVSFQLQNLTGYDIEDAEIWVIPEVNVDLLNASGNVVDYESSTMTTRYYAFDADKLNAYGNGTYTLTFQATPAAPTYYRQIDIAVVVDGETISTKSVYVYCPGTGSASIAVTATSPSILYKEGTQTLMISGSGFGGLSNKGAYSVVLSSQDSDQTITVNSTDMNVNVADNVMTLPFTTTEEMTLGDWDITINWTDTEVEDIHTTAMTFTVTDDQKYMANSYGVITIERESYDSEEYSIKAYDNESAYYSTWLGKGNLSGEASKVLLVFRGIFTITKDSAGNITQVNGLSNKTVTGTIQNTMTISNCLDIEDGTLTITDENDTIDIDINAKVYTTGARTSVWNGVCAITSFVDGVRSDLIQYNYNGEVVGDVTNSVGDESAITLVWPGVAGAFQSIAGVLMEFRYAQFGQMAEDAKDAALGFDPYDDRDRVIAFGAQLSTDLLVPSSLVTTVVELSTMEKQYDDMLNSSTGYTAEDLRLVQEVYSASQELFQDLAGASLGLYATDIIYGGGFIGFNCSLEVGIPAYFDGMPSLEGVLSLKVINEEWGFGVEGEADLVVFEMEGSLKLRSYNGIPVLDELYFYVGGFTPGVNPDCYGVFWIQGAGGGISELYETIFPVATIPPLTLMLSGQFAIFQLLTARADLSLSLRGYTVELSKIGIALGTSTLEVIESLALECYWYPELHIYGGIGLSLLDLLNGTGYLVLEEDDYTYFYEGYAGCTLQVPDDIWVIGGLQIGNVGVGINDDGLFAAAQALKVDFGVSYGWGDGSLAITLGDGDTVTPSYDASASAMSDSAVPVLMSEPMAIDTVATDEKNHIISLDDYDEGNDYIVTVTYVATSEEEARSIASSMSVTNGDGTNMTDTWNWATDSTDTEDADAMFSIVESNGVYKTTVAFSVTDEDYFGENWTVTTSVDSVVEQYAMARMADLESAELAGETVIVTGDMDQFETVSVYAVDDSGIRYLLAETSEPSGTTCSLTFSEDYLAVLPTGEYTIEAVAKTIDCTSNPIVQAEGTFEYENEDQPDAPTISRIALGGDYTMDVSVGSTDADGYIATVYEVVNGERVATDFASMYMDTDDTLTLGGQFNQVLYDDDGGQEIVTMGLEAGKTYSVGLKAYNNLDDSSDSNGLVMKSAETFSGNVTMIAPVETTLTFSIDDSVALLSPTSVDSSVKYDTVASGDVTIDISSTASISSAQYRLDGGAFVNMSSVDSITLEDLEAGVHRLYIMGENSAGDVFQADYIFVVDTVAPKLSLSTYGGGGFYTVDSNSITVTGLTEADATLYVNIEGKAVEATSQTIADDGTFEITIPLDASVAYQYVTIYAEDTVGNKSESLPIPMTNQTFFANADDMMLLLEDEDITNQTISAGSSGTLSVGVEADGDIITLNDDSAVMTYGISYSVTAVEGTASISGSVLDSSDDVNALVAADVDGITYAAVLGGTTTDEPVSLPSTVLVNGVESTITLDADSTVLILETDTGATVTITNLSDLNIATLKVTITTQTGTNATGGVASITVNMTDASGNYVGSDVTAYVTMPVPEDFDSSEDYSLYKVDSQGAKTGNSVEYTLNTEDRTISFTANGFSTYALYEDEADITGSLSLALDKTSYDVGDTVTVTIVADQAYTNVGGLQFTVDKSIDGLTFVSATSDIFSLQSGTNDTYADSVDGATSIAINEDAVLATITYTVDADCAQDSNITVPVTGVKLSNSTSQAYYEGDLSGTFQLSQYTVTLSLGGATVSGVTSGDIVYKGTDIIFTVTPASDYTISQVAYTIGSDTQTLTANADGSYTIDGTDVTGNIIITVSTVQWVKITLSVGTGVSYDGSTTFYAKKGSIGLYSAMGGTATVGADDLAATLDTGYYGLTYTIDSTSTTVADIVGTEIYTADTTITLSATQAAGVTYGSTTYYTTSAGQLSATDVDTIIAAAQSAAPTGQELKSWNSSTITDLYNYSFSGTTTLTADYGLVDYTFTTSAPDGFMIAVTGGTPSTVNYGTDISFTITEPDGQQIVSVQYTVGNAATVDVPEESGTYTIPGSAVLGNITVIISVENTYTVSYVIDSSWTAAGTLSHNAEVVAENDSPEAVPTWTLNPGYAFSHWEDASGNEVDDFTAETITSNVTYYAVFALGVYEVTADFDDVATTATYLSDLTFTPAVDSGIVIGITATMDGSAVTVMNNGDGSYTIQGSAITGELTLSAITLNGEVTFIGANTYKAIGDSMQIAVVKMEYMAGTTLRYADISLFWSSEYSAYVLPVFTSVDESTFVQNLTTTAGTSGNTQLSYGGDVKSDGTVDIYDAVHINSLLHSFDLSNTTYQWILEADVDGDGVVTTTDINAVITIIIGADDD